MSYSVTVEKGWLGRKAALIRNPDQHTTAYHADFKGSSDIDIRRGGPQGPIVGKVGFHKWSGYTDVMFGNNQTVKLKRDGTFSKAEGLLLPASPKQSQFHWKRPSFMSDSGGLTLEDAEGMVLATFAKPSRRSMDGVLTLNVTGLSQDLLDQIFVSFLAVVEKQQRQKQAGIAAAAGGSAAAC